MDLGRLKTTDVELWGNAKTKAIILKINRIFKEENEDIFPLCIQSLILTAPQRMKSHFKNCSFTASCD